VGVVGNILHDLEWDPRRSRYAIYYPWAQNSFRYLAVTLHSSGDPEALKEEVRKTFGRIEPNIAFSFLGAADELMAQDLMQYTVARRMLVQVAGLGLLLAAVGIYGVVANLAAERTKEIGIRMALGAQPRDVIWLFLGNGVRLALIGTGLGLAGAFGLNKALGHLLSDFPGNDPWVVGSVGIVLITVTLVACWLPARGATRVNPMDALRAD
jgi:ABC-type antimicrobial peptide transport system permease subunit